MHEASLIGGLVAHVERVAQENAATKVVSIDIWVGALAHLSANHLREHFKEASQGSVAEGAELIIDHSDNVHHGQAHQIILKSVEVLDQEMDA